MKSKTSRLSFFNKFPQKVVKGDFILVEASFKLTVKWSHVRTTKTYPTKHTFIQALPRLSPSATHRAAAVGMWTQG